MVDGAAVPPEDAVSLEAVRGWLAEIRDPEMPYVSIADVGILREVAQDGGVLRVTITSTYSGCPGHRAIVAEIGRVLESRGIADYAVDTRLSPPWSTDWITPAGREAMSKVGIAPPERAWDRDLPLSRRLRGLPPPCPRCGSARTSRSSPFGAAACRALARCEACRDTFEYLKCI